MDVSLDSFIRQEGYAYIRNLSEAEAAIQRGEFNNAKILRALAHTHRVLALRTARKKGSELPPAELLKIDLEEMKELDQATQVVGMQDFDAKVMLKQSSLVQTQARDLILRAIQSLETHTDVMESDVAQSLWGCYNCGYVAEGNRPEACPICGALGAEFEWFGPFYAATPEHLGQLTPMQILATLENIPEKIAEIISDVDDDILSHKPSEGEWSVKEIVAHIFETDLLFAQRVTTLLEGQGVPDLTTPVPPWKLHEGKGYEKMPVSDLLDRLRQVRSASLAIVRGLEPEQWSRRGTLRGTSTSLIDLGTWLANHDLGHAAQIRRLCDK